MGGPGSASGVAAHTAAVFDIFCQLAHSEDVSLELPLHALNHMLVRGRQLQLQIRIALFGGDGRQQRLRSAYAGMDVLDPSAIMCCVPHQR